ncbi:WD40 repeat domain-containing protein [Chloropicon primus]|nr:WD40 repeat domain-containing protein [Chloropicon primus]
MEEELERVKTETSRDDNKAFEEKPVEEKYRTHNGGKALESKLEWDVDANETGTVNQKCLCQSFSADGRMVAVGTTGGMIKIVNVTGDTPSLRSNIEVVKGKEIDPITSVKFQPCVAESNNQQNLLLACTSGGRLFQYHTTTGQLVWKSQEEGNKLFASGFLCDGRHFVTGGSDSALRIYDAAKRKRVTVYKKGGYRSVGHTSNIYSICGHPTDPNVFCSSGWDSCLNIYDVRSPVPVAATHGPYVSGDAVDIARDNPNHIVTGSRRTTNMLQLWDFRVNKEPMNYVKLLTNLPFKKKASEAPCLLYGARFVSHGIFGKPCIIAGGGGENPLARTFDRDLLKNTGTVAAGAPVYSIDVHEDPDDREKSKVSVLLSNKLQLFQGVNLMPGDGGSSRGSRGTRRTSVKSMSSEYDIRKSKVPPKWVGH